jgi:hypothetical protein
VSFVVDEVALGMLYLPVLRFPLSIFIPPTVSYSLVLSPDARPDAYSVANNRLKKTNGLTSKNIFNEYESDHWANRWY